VAISRKTIANVFKYLLSLAIGGGLMAWAFKDVSWSEMMTGLRDANYIWVMLGLIVAVWSHWLRAARWVILFDAAGYKTNTFNLFASVMVGNMVNQALPRAGEISRPTITAKSEKVPLSVSFGTTVTDRIFDVITLGVLVGLSFLLQFKEIMMIIDKTFADHPESGSVPVDQGPSLWPWIVLATLVVVGMLIFVFRDKSPLQNLISRATAFSKETLKAVLTVRKMDRWFMFIVYSIAIWLCYVAMTYLVFFAFDATADLGFEFALMAFTMGAIGIVLPSPGGIGSYHFAIQASFVAYASNFGWTVDYAKTLGLNLAFVIHTSQMVMMILVGAGCYFYLLRQIKAQNKPTQPSL
jgi:uncharacterized membrane protein YbhN (UPF0104 family)